MSVQPERLLAVNGGEVESAFFPGEDPLVRLRHFVTEGEGRVRAWRAAHPDVTDQLFVEDDAVTAWAYHRAFRQAHTVLISNPARSDLNDQGQQQYLAQQIAEMANAAERWRREYDGLLGGALERLGVVVPGGTTSVFCRFTP